MNWRTFKRWLTALYNNCYFPSWLGTTISLILGACAIKCIYDQQQLINTSTRLAQWMAKNEFIALCQAQKVGLPLFFDYLVDFSESFRSELNQHQTIHNPIKEPCKIAMRKSVPPYSFITINNTTVALEKQMAFKNGTVSPRILSTWRATQAALNDLIPWQKTVIMWCALSIILNLRLLVRFINFCMEPPRYYWLVSYNPTRTSKLVEPTRMPWHPPCRPWPSEPQRRRRQRKASWVALFALLCFLIWLIWLFWRAANKVDKCERFCEQTSISRDMEGFWKAAAPDRDVVEECWHTRCLTNLARRSVYAHARPWAKPHKYWGPRIKCAHGERRYGLTRHPEC